MIWTKRRKSRPDVPPASKSTPAAPPPVRRGSLGNTRLPFAPLDPHQETDDMHDPKSLYGRQILTLDEQQQVARQNSPSPPPNFSLPRRDPGASASSSRHDPNADMIYTTNSLSSFVFGPATEPPPSPGRSIGPLDEIDEDDMRRRADETPRQSLASTARATRHDPRTPAAYYSPSRSDAASHHTFGTSSASSASSPASRSGSRSRTTSNSTTHTSLDDYLGGVTFNPMHHHPLPPGDSTVEFDSEEDEFSEEYDGDADAIEVSSARGGGSMEGAAFETAFELERQMYSERRPSLPMAIPGAPDTRYESTATATRREREGSLATLRRPSRSLDDQVSVLTLGPGPLDTTANNAQGGAQGATQPVSVPETDGDWRSLSARAMQRGTPSPTVPTMPTFAPSIAPINSTHRNSMRNSVASAGAGGIDGLGFDLDWGQMGKGITGLDMNDVAVHAGASRGSVSSAVPLHPPTSFFGGGRRPSQLSLMLRRPSTASGGSVMDDPDTFSAAVRRWGGDEYDRQRKYWTFKRDAADGRGTHQYSASNTGAGASSLGRGKGVGAGVGLGAALSPVRSITGGSKTGSRAGGGSVMSGVSGHGQERPKHVPWRGMQLNAEEIWNSSLVGGFKVRRIELRPQKPQQRVTIDPFRGPYTLGPKPPHDGAYTNIHKHSKVMAFSIHRHYKPSRSLFPVFANEVFSSPSGRGSVSGASGRGSTSTSASPSPRIASRGLGFGTASTGSVGTATTTSKYELERRKPTAMILLAPRHVQEAYTSTNTTKGLRSHGLLDEGRERDRERERDTRSTGRGEREEAKKRSRGGGGKEKDRERGGRSSSSKTPTNSSVGSFSPPPPTASAPPGLAHTHTYPPPTSSSNSTLLDSRIIDGAGPSLGGAARRRPPGDADSDDDLSDTERLTASSRTTHNEAFSTMDASSIDQMVLAQDALRYGESSNGVLSRVLRRAPAHPTGPAVPHQVYVPPWVTLQSRVKQEERRRRHDVLSNSFEDVGLLPPKKSSGGVRAKKAPVAGVDIFAQVPADALFMLLPLWPGPTDPVSERTATRAPHEIPTEQRQYLLVSYKPTEERAAPSKRHDGHGHGETSSSSGRSKKGSSHSSPTSSGDGGGSGGRGCDILLSSYHISARLVSHSDLQGSGVRVPDEGLAVLGPWHEAWLSMPQIATRDHGLLVIGRCDSREAGIEFDPEGLVKMGLCIPVQLDAAGAQDGDDGMQEEPVAELTPIGKAVLEMAWIGCIAVTSFGPVVGAS
ncbi:hypothetical protein C8F04DRAFT_455665 [Mycena alexandri]|uniref:Uncharacterized protein n=1 Tax=Mycena alexandri TaxID=1745969 RepID=A0AAD6TJ76_9AGAR|nr:hypothetical protein C8F04DRAFT_455665 [Mycena alexandri]